MAEGDEDRDNREYYSQLNVSEDATPEEIRKAYRRLCRTFHPDRYQDEHRQSLAAEHFSRIQEAYKVLSDPRLRKVYDRKGKVGLMEDMAIVERTPIPSELYEEYEKLRALWEERTYIQDSLPMSTFKMKVDATGLTDGMRYNDDDDDDDYYYGTSEDEYLDPLALVTLTELYYEQSVHASPTSSDVCTISAYGGAKKLESVVYEGGLLLGLKHMLTNHNYLELVGILQDRPCLGLSIGHGIVGGIFGTLKTVIALSGSAITLGGTCILEKRLSNVTKGVLSADYATNSTTLKLVHQYSSTTSVSGEVCVGEEESYTKGTILYRLIPKYVFHSSMNVGTKGASFEYGINHEIARLTIVGASVELSPSAGVALKLKLSRAFMNFSVKIKMSNFVGPAVLLYATSIPLALYGCIRAIRLAPVLQKEWLEDVAKQKKEMTREVAEKKARAESAVELMQETLERVVNAEQAKHGLLITEAWYGKLFDQIQSDEAEVKVVDVRIPLQCLVADSKLILHGTSKGDIPGFYDPCVGEKKFLRVRYEFRGTAHEVTIKDSEPLSIPRPSHKLGNA